MISFMSWEETSVDRMHVTMHKGIQMLSERLERKTVDIFDIIF